MSVNRCSVKDQFSDIWKLIFDIALIAIILVVALFIGARGAAQGMLIGAIFGIAAHWSITAKASICIDNMLLPYARTWVEQKGYVPCKDDSELMPNTHRLLRFDSQNIKFLPSDESKTMMFGPYYILKQFQKSI